MSLNINIQYLSDDKGNRTAVQIPIKDWLLINENLPTILKYLSMKEGLRSAFKEMKQIQNGEKEAMTLDDFFEKLDSNED